MQDDERQSDVPLHYKVSDHSREVFIMKKKPSKRKATDISADGEGCSASKSKNSRSDSVYSAMPTSVKEKLTDELCKTMIEDARASALETLVKPGTEKSQLDSQIRNVAQKFGRPASFAVPARVMPKLSKATKSVGLIKCGDCTGTCFLLRKDVIITCQHVINDMYTKRSQSTDKKMYKTISVYFNFIRSNFGTCYGLVDEKEIYAGDGKLDYAICCIKRDDSDRSTPRNLTELGSFVRSPLPRDGLVILVGHPESDYKRVEICRILSSYNWHSTLCKRASDAEQCCQQHPEECKVFNNRSESCVHIWKARALQGDHPDQLPYDTSFFHGSSGSPVFNCDGHIIAMHTQGYPFYQGSKKVSLMEFGVTFGAICRDVKQRFVQETVKYLFLEECKDSSHEQAT